MRGFCPWMLGLDCRPSVAEAEPLARGSRQKLNLSGDCPQIPLITFTKVSAEPDATQLHPHIRTSNRGIILHGEIRSAGKFTYQLLGASRVPVQVL